MENAAQDTIVLHTLRNFVEQVYAPPWGQVHSSV